MSTKSNNTGRALEYAIALTLKKHFDSNKNNYFLTEKTIMDNKRDKSYFEALLETKQEDFLLASSKFVDWIQNEGWFNDADKITLDRLPDSEGRHSNVTDIELKIERGENIEQKNISVKHNHNALKHPRLPRLPGQCGILDEGVGEEWQKEHERIWKEFISESKILSEKATLFRELKVIDPDYINKKLYKPLAEAVSIFLNKNSNNPKNSKIFFNFLTNELDFYTIKNENDKIVIKKFIDIPSPSSFTIEYPYNKILSTLKIKFDNSWELTLRLHTASSRMYTPLGNINTSVKFDVLCENLDEVIEIEEISKS